MAKATKRSGKVQKHGRRVLPAIRRKLPKAAAVTQRVLTLGELIAAAFDTVGAEVKDVARVLGSREMAAATGKRIVLV